MGQSDIGGPYVNDDDRRVVGVRDQRVIRFGLFDGDRVVVPGRSRVGHSR